MKSPKFLLATIALFMSLAAFSQTDTTSKKDTTTQKKDTVTKTPPSIISETTTINTQEQPAANITRGTESNVNNTSSSTNSTTQTLNGATTNSTAVTDNAVSNSVTSSTPKPNFGRYYIPVLGSYTATSADSKSISITADESNPGKVWIDGLTGTKFYALLKAVPGTYKVPAQKQDKSSIAEGTIVYDENSKQINVCLGCGYNEQSPAVADASTTAKTEEVSKSKNKKVQHATKPKTTIVSFTGTKSDQSIVSILQ